MTLSVEVVVDGGDCGDSFPFHIISRIKYISFHIKRTRIHVKWTRPSTEMSSPKFHSHWVNVTRKIYGPPNPPFSASTHINRWAVCLSVLPIPRPSSESSSSASLTVFYFSSSKMDERKMMNLFFQWWISSSASCVSGWVFQSIRWLTFWESNCILEWFSLIIVFSVSSYYSFCLGCPRVFHWVNYMDDISSDSMTQFYNQELTSKRPAMDALLCCDKNNNDNIG